MPAPKSQIHGALSFWSELTWLLFLGIYFDESGVTDLIALAMQDSEFDESQKTKNAGIFHLGEISRLQDRTYSITFSGTYIDLETDQKIGSAGDRMTIVIDSHGLTSLKFDD